MPNIPLVLRGLLTRGCIIVHYILSNNYPTLIAPKDVCVLGLLSVIGEHISITNDKGKDITEEKTTHRKMTITQNYFVFVLFKDYRLFAKMKKDVEGEEMDGNLF